MATSSSFIIFYNVVEAHGFFFNAPKFRFVNTQKPTDPIYSIVKKYVNPFFDKKLDKVYPTGEAYQLI